MAKRKGTNNYLQNITQKTTDRATRTYNKSGVNTCAPEGWTVLALNAALIDEVLFTTNKTDRTINDDSQQDVAWKKLLQSTIWQTGTNWSLSLFYININDLEYNFLLSEKIIWVSIDLK